MDENSNSISKIVGDDEIAKNTTANPNSIVTNSNNGTDNDDVVVVSVSNNDNDNPSSLSSSNVDGVRSENNSNSNSNSSRTPFTNLSQVDADLALARTLQEQERAYMMLSMNGGGAGYGMWDTGIYFHDDEDEDFGDSHDHEYDDVDDDDDDDDEDENDMDNYDDDDEEDAFDVHAHADSGESNTQTVALDPAAFPDDEAFARALQDAEEREMAARLLAMAGITEREIEDVEEEDQGANSQDTWEEVDPDELSYEELLALGEVVGTESRGLSADRIASLPSTNYKSQNTQEADRDPCVICRLDYEDGDALTTLPCKHAYHSECINNWLKINKACPVCSTEVSTSGNS